uniref:Uncharacterized protein n=1 Tax=Globodera rostochiensis TaxID=31243 RepID=A0A914IES6_GLORO
MKELAQNPTNQKIALNKTVKEESVEKRLKSEFMEFDRISDKEEFDNGKDAEEQSTDSYSIFDNSNSTESSSKSQKEKQKRHTRAEMVGLFKKFYKIEKENPQLRKDEIAQILNINVKTLYFWKRKSKSLKFDVKKNYSETEKQEKIAEFDKLKNEFKTQANGMSYDIKKIDEKIAQKLGVSRATIYNWKHKFGDSKKQNRHTEAEKAEFVKQFYKIEKENPKMNKEEIAQKLNISLRTINSWKRQFLNKVDNGGPIDNVQRNGGSERSTSSADSLNDIPQKIEKIKKEIVVKDEPNDYDEFDQFSNERQQKIALNKTVKEESVEKRVKSEFMEFDRISDKEEFDNGKDAEEQSTDSLFENSNLKESSSKSQKGVRKIYSEIEKQKLIAEFDELKNEFKTRANGMSYDLKKLEGKIAQKLGVSLRTIYYWKTQLGISKKQNSYTDSEKVELLEDEIAQMLNINVKTLHFWKRKSKSLKFEKQKRHSDAEKVELLKNFYKIKKENPQLPKDEIAQMLNIHISNLSRWKREFSKPGVRKNYSELEKEEIIAEFDKLKKEFKTRAKGMSYDKIDEKVAQKLGVARATIYNWKHQFGVSKKQKRLTEAEKAEFVKQFYKIEKENPQMYKEDIAQKLNISLRTINSWKRQFLNNAEIGGPIDNVQQNGGSERSTSSANSLNDIPWKWNDFGKKRNERI